MQRERNSSDAAEDTNAKRNKEGSANNADSNTSTVDDDANLDLFLSKFRESKYYSPQLEAILTPLRSVKRDTLLKDTTAMAKLQTDVERKQLAVSKLAPSSDPDKSYTPVPLRSKTNELKASKKAKDEFKFGQLQDEADKVSETYKVEMKRVYRETAQLECEVKFKAFRELYFRKAMKWTSGEILTLENEMGDSFKSNLSNRDLAGNAVFLMLSSGLNSGYFARLGLDRESCCKEFKDTYFPRGLSAAKDTTEYNSESLAVKLSSGLICKLSNSAFALFDLIKQRAKNKVLDAELKEVYENEEQYAAQNDVKEILTQDDPMEADEQIGDLVDTKVKRETKALHEKLRRIEQQNKALQKQLKAQARQKSSGGGTDPSLNARSNGNENNGGSTNSSRQQSRKQKQKQQRAQRHRNQNRPRQGSGRGGSNKSAARR